MKTLVLVLLAYCSYTAAMECDADEIQCANEEKCIPHRYICDRDDDCQDESDEDSELCSLWRNDECDRNEIKCSRDGNEECITIWRYCTTSDPPCDDILDRRVCQMLENDILGDLDDIILNPVGGQKSNLEVSRDFAERFRALIPNTLRHEDCPPMFTLVGDQCLSIFHIGNMGWSESREFCKLLNADLITFKNITHFTTVVQHLQRHELVSSFWIGGYHENETQSWIWIDGTPMVQGTPYWASRFSMGCTKRNGTESRCFNYVQAPEEDSRSQCVSLSLDHYFQMIDEDCVRNISPLCVYEGSIDFPKRTFFR